MKVILVTGGAGFIGSNVVGALLERGDRAVCIDNFSGNYDPAYKEENVAEFASDPNFALYRADICDAQAIDRIFTEERPEAVVHLAAKADTRNSVKNPQEYIDVNVTGTL